MIAIRMAQQFPDKFPGDPTINAVEARITLNDLLQEQSYLTTMMSDAGIAGRGADAAAALGAIAGVRTDLAPVMGFLLGPDGRAGFPGIWGIRDADLFAYANASDPGARQRLTGTFVTQFSALTHAPATTIRDQMIATLKAIDDQRAKAYKNLAGDDRAAAAAMQSMADQIG
jgi:phage tail tape-measure protein